MTQVLLERMSAEVIANGLSDVVFRELLGCAPDPRSFALVVDDLAPRAPTQGRFGLAELALNLAIRDRRFRPAAETSIRGADFHSAFMTTLCNIGGRASGEDLLWWYSVFLRDIRIDPLHDDLLARHGELLLSRRYDDVLAYLLEPDRGPAGRLTDSYSRVLAHLRSCAPLEQRWASWIRRGLFDTGRPSSESGRVLAGCLTELIDRSVPAGPDLLQQATRHWRSLLDDGDRIERRRCIRTLAEMLFSGPLVADRVVIGDDVLVALLHDVVPAAERASLPEAGALRDAVTTGHGLLLHRSEYAKKCADSAGYRLLAATLDVEKHEPDLPWRHE